MSAGVLTRREVMVGLAAAGAAVRQLSAKTANERWRVLLVVAHPDDEYYFAATVYRLAQELNAAVDQVIITNGEGGFRYSALAEKLYGCNLTDEQTGRAKLPEIRRRETLAAGKILGIRQHHFLGERDARFTLNAGEALNEIWDSKRIKSTLRDLIERERYDFVFTVLPREDTHGHHQAATLLALEAVSELAAERRPAVLAAEAGRSCELVPFSSLPGFPATQAAYPEPAVVFDRTRSFGFQDALRYEIVVNWVISEHKSQGMFQNDWSKHDLERLWLLALGPEDAAERTARLAEELAGSRGKESH
jgi:LmbE family N-acetylglucosaminyl deacetylase